MHHIEFKLIQFYWRSFIPRQRTSSPLATGLGSARLWKRLIFWKYHIHNSHPGSYRLIVIQHRWSELFNHLIFGSFCMLYSYGAAHICYSKVVYHHHQINYHYYSSNHLQQEYSAEDSNSISQHLHELIKDLSALQDKLNLYDEQETINQHTDYFLYPPIYF